MNNNSNRVIGKPMYGVCFIIIFLFLLVGCDNENLNITKVTGKTSVYTEINPTEPSDKNWKTINEPVALGDILDLKWDEIEMVTVIEYINSEKAGTKSFNNADKISEIKEVCDQIWVSHSTEKHKDGRLEYEIHFHLLNNSEKFLSFSTTSDEETFAVGGSFIDYNNLSPILTLTQTNSKITFHDIEQLCAGLMRD